VVVNLGKGLTEVLLHVMVKVAQGGLHGGLHHVHKFLCQILLGLVVNGRMLHCGGARWAVLV